MQVPEGCWRRTDYFRAGLLCTSFTVTSVRVVPSASAAHASGVELVPVALTK